MLEIAEAEPAIRLVDRNAVQADRAHLRPELLREPVLGVDSRGERRDAVVGEAARGVADHLGILAEREIEIGGGDHRAALAERGRFEQGERRA